MNNISSPSHPLWSILRLTILMMVLTCILYFNASDFDATEIKTLTQYFLAAASLEGGVAVVKSMIGKNKE
jgi:hypothetical protein